MLWLLLIYSKGNLLQGTQERIAGGALLIKWRLPSCWTFCITTFTPCMMRHYTTNQGQRKSQQQPSCFNMSHLLCKLTLQWSSVTGTLKRLFLSVTAAYGQTKVSQKFSRNCVWVDIIFVTYSVWPFLFAVSLTKYYLSKKNKCLSALGTRKLTHPWSNTLLALPSNIIFMGKELPVG